MSSAIETEKRTLPIGIEYEGKVHREVEVAPRKVRQLLAASKDPTYLADKGAYEICCLASQIERIGEIPKEAITGELLLDMFEEDFDVLTEAAEAVRKRTRTFRKSGLGETSGIGDAEAGVSVPDDNGDEP